MNIYRRAYYHSKDLPAAFWFIILATLFNQIGNMAVVYLVIYLNIAKDYSLINSATALVVFSASMLMSGLLAGKIINRYGPLKLMMVTIICNGIILLSFPWLENFFAVCLSCVLWGLVYGVYRPASTTCVGDLSPAGLHKITFSIYRLAVNLGMSIGPALGGWLAAKNFNSIFYFNALMNLCAGVVLWVGNNHSLAAPQLSSNNKNLFSWQYLAQDKRLLGFLLALLPISMVFFQHEATLPVFLHTQLGYPLSFYGLLFTLNTLLIVAFELPLNVATLNWPYKVNFILGTFGIGLGFFGLSFLHQTLAILVLTVIWTFGEMILYPAANSYVAERAGDERRAAYMSLLSTVANLAMLLGPWLGSLIMQFHGATVLWLICGTWALFSVAGFALLPKKA